MGYWCRCCLDWWPTPLDPQGRCGRCAATGWYRPFGAHVEKCRVGPPR